MRFQVLHNEPLSSLGSSLSGRCAGNSVGPDRSTGANAKVICVSPLFMLLDECANRGVPAKANKVKFEAEAHDARSSDAANIRDWREAHFHWLPSR